MNYITAFLVAGFICMVGQVLLDTTKLTAGHITTLFVVLGAFLDIFSLYDKIIDFGGGGALVVITSFGHSLIHGALAKAEESGLFGLFLGMFDLTSSGIIAAIIFSFVFCLIFNPKD